jgi:3-hydroxyacyl-CoA dehydrogenase/enoyl-CoA hydratase/3-hydroxybutyryl-CoA epimerase
MRDQMMESTIAYELDSAGIVTLTLDDPTSPVNSMNDAYARSMHQIVGRLHTDRDKIAGVVLTSAKSSFFAGGDLTRLAQATPADAGDLFAMIEGIKADLRRLETLGRPVVAAIGGSALGGGLEIALACHHRIAVSDDRIELGFPEVTLGLLPGAGGVTRAVRMFGLQRALTEMLLRGQRMKPAKALELGLVDELVAEPGDLLPAARRWVLDHCDDPASATQPWDREGFRLPGGTPSSPRLAQLLPAFPATLRKELKGAPYPAPRAIMAAAVEGAQTDLETALRIESRYFVELATGPIAKNMIQAFFFDLQAINAGRSRPAGVPRFTASRIGILGAGMMGAGIAYVSARAGVHVVLKDTTVEAAEKGKAFSALLLDAQVDRGRLSESGRDAVLGRIQPTEKAADLSGCDVVIEAVFENRDLKHQVFAEIDDLVSSGTLLCSNTSTLPISELATSVTRPGDFIGLHFFSPVEKMPLVEIIVGSGTSDRAIAMAYDVARQLDKTPIVVGDSRGFFTSRVFATLVLEGAAMVAEGIAPSTVERAATQAGFPAPPLAMLDEVSLTLTQAIREETRAAAASAGRPAPAEHPGMAVVDRLVDEFGRRGKAAGAGFYDYPADAPKRLWAGLSEHFSAEPSGSAVSEQAFADLQERFTFVMSLETIRCVAEGVLRSTSEANIGSILGIGFPAMYGGALQYVNNYRGRDGGSGIAAFEARARELTASYGSRFDPPELLIEKAASGRHF